MERASGDETLENGGESSFTELLRRAGVEHLRQLPLEVEQEIQQFLRAAGRAIVPALAQAVGDRDAKTRMKAVTYLGQVRVAESVPPLARAATDVDPRVRLLAILSLKECGEVAAVPALLGAMADEDERVRGAALEAFSWLTNHPHGADPWAAPAEREAAVERLQSWWDEHADEPGAVLRERGFRERGYEGDTGLLRALGDPLPFVRANALRALQAKTGAHHTFEEELREVDPGGEVPYEEARAQALERLQERYRRLLRT